MKKRIISFIGLLLIAAMCLCSCGGGNGASENDKRTEEVRKIMSQANAESDGMYLATEVENDENEECIITVVIYMDKIKQIVRNQNVDDAYFDTIVNSIVSGTVVKEYIKNDILEPAKKVFEGTGKPVYIECYKLENNVQKHYTDLSSYDD